MPGVLVLVEQHHPVAAPQLLADLRERRAASRAAAAICKPKSITFSARMRACSASISGHELGAFGLGGQHPQQPLAGPAVALVRTGRQRVHQPLQLDVGVAQLVGVDEVLGQLPDSRSTIAVTAAGVLSVSSAPRVVA